MKLNKKIIIGLSLVLLSACTATQPTNPPSPTPQGQKTSTQTTQPIQTLTPTPVPTPTPEPKIIGEFSTKIVDKTKSRLKNLQLACEFISSDVIDPNAEFSFNNSVGVRTRERGFEKGYVFEGKKKVEAVGGGICQISSTLYNAARNAGMEITERHPHKRKVDYVKSGDDATVAYGKLDFRFKNPQDRPVKIEAYLTDTEVVIRIWTA